MGAKDREAWLYVIAEPTLRQYSQRIANDLPEDPSTLQSKKVNENYTGSHARHADGNTADEAGNKDISAFPIEQQGKSELQVTDSSLMTLTFSQYYRQYLLSLI
ncbi:hypothetical protein HME01_29120 [Vreelandella aquamarina]|nr:hypothetical protein HME01_29120 [Halomonas meridiana]